MNQQMISHPSNSMATYSKPSEGLFGKGGRESPFSRLTCKSCGKIFSSIATLQRHRVWHHKEMDDVFKYNCALCPYATNHNNRFKSHKLVHEPNRKYMCKECGNGFQNTQSLKCHELIHTDLLKGFIGYVCNDCHKWFTSSITLRRHSDWHHKGKKIFKFYCPHCPYATDKKFNLSAHSPVHKPGREHRCETCGNGFNSLCSLNKHNIIHTGERLSPAYTMKAIEASRNK
ncbi:hypothetical protein CEXT_64951 [Caerostris extrusa]|uniref:C2H2-type domain-containing protein n=1 Tax=Caerostris extrusa TaxID=172846 RepID=A0AAV4SZG6_CAEEX|nr:hypothetical protein CEXT_64951 [Caerostris extrusa]